MGHQLLNVSVCLLWKGVEIDVYTWILIHWGGIVEWSPLVDVGYAWVLRFIQRFQCSRLEWKIQNSLKSPSRMGWEAPVRPQSHQQSYWSPKPCDQWGFGQPVSHNENQFLSVLNCLAFSFQSNNLTCGNYLFICLFSFCDAFSMSFKN